MNTLACCPLVFRYSSYQRCEITEQVLCLDKCFWIKEENTDPSDLERNDSLYRAKEISFKRNVLCGLEKMTSSRNYRSYSIRTKVTQYFPRSSCTWYTGDLENFLTSWTSLRGILRNCFQYIPLNSGFLNQELFITGRFISTNLRICFQGHMANFVKHL